MCFGKKKKRDSNKPLRKDSDSSTDSFWTSSSGSYKGPKHPSKEKVKKSHKKSKSRKHKSKEASEN